MDSRWTDRSAMSSSWAVDNADQYSSYTALLYIFNLIVGTGVLTLPKAFSEAGWILSVTLISFLAVVSYITATFVIESVSLCSTIIQWDRVEKMKNVSRSIRSATEADSDSDEGVVEDEDALILPQEYIDNFPSEPQRLYSLDVKVEMSEMASLLFNRVGKFLFYLCLCLYLYGDLTIYSAAVAKTIVDTTCKFNATNDTLNDPCWDGYDFRKPTLYKMFLSVFLLILGPFVFFNVQKTKYLQMCTLVTRWSTFLLMIALAIIRLATPNIPHGSPPRAVLAGLPALVGSSVYSFMCHHSLPGLIMPISDKTGLVRHLAYDYALILAFYLTLALTAIFAFPTIQDLYTLNFEPDDPNASLFFVVVGYILALFPVYTLTTNFPIISVTLRSNLQAMFSRVKFPLLHSLWLPLLTVIPPVLIAMSTENIEILVGVTGSFAGAVIQYVIPATIVLLARRAVPPGLKNVPNVFSSPFKSAWWPVLVLIWAVVSVSLVSYNLIVNKRF